MFQINQGKHTVDEIQGVRCSIVETGATEERVQFLKSLLELNKFEVKIKEEAPAAKKEELPTNNEVRTTNNEQRITKTYTIGVTDLIFFPTVAIYERALYTPEGHHVTPAYWKQYTTVCDPRYWRKRGKPSGK